MTEAELLKIKPGDILRCGFNRFWWVLRNEDCEWGLEVTEVKKTFVTDHHQRGSWVSGIEQLKRVA